MNLTSHKQYERDYLIASLLYCLFFGAWLALGISIAEHRPAFNRVVLMSITPFAAVAWLMTLGMVMNWVFRQRRSL